MGQRACATTLHSELTPEELACLTAVLREASLPGRHLEIGTAAGGTLCAMLECFGSGELPPFVVVDPMTYFQDQEAIVRRNLREHGFENANVQLRATSSAEALEAAIAAGETYDFVFIDGNHKIRYVTRDLGWGALLNPGGLLCLHDYHPQFSGVMLPVRRFLRKNPNYRHMAQVGNLLVLRKAEVPAGAGVTLADHLFAALLSAPLQWRQSWRKRTARLHRSGNAR